MDALHWILLALVVGLLIIVWGLAVTLREEREVLVRLLDVCDRREETRAACERAEAGMGWDTSSTHTARDSVGHLTPELWR